MTLTIVPFTVNPGHDYSVMSLAEEQSIPITYWGIYLDDKNISYTSSRELAEKTKTWMEKWLRLA